MESSGRSLAVAAAITWVLTASIGLYMLRAWIAHGGLRRPRGTENGPAEAAGVPPAVVFGHAGAAITGLVIWLAFVATGWDALAWGRRHRDHRGHHPGHRHRHVVDPVPGRWSRPAGRPGGSGGNGSAAGAR